MVRQHRIAKQRSRARLGFKPSGIVVPMVTPFENNRGRSVDFETLDKFVDFLIGGGIHALLPLGTSGEFALLSSSERNAVIQRVVSRCGGRVPVIAGVSSPGTAEAVRLAIDAQEAGADAVIATGPYYFKTDDEGLFRHYRSLIDAVDVPVMIYNIPDWVGYNVPSGVAERLVDENPGRLVGVKVTTYDMKILLGYLRTLADRISIITGADALILSALQLGAAGAVVGIANALPREASDIYESFKQGKIDAAKKIEAKIYVATQAIGLGTFPAALKEAMKIVGMDCGPVRPPLEAVSQGEVKKLRETFRPFGNANARQKRGH